MSERHRHDHVPKRLTSAPEFQALVLDLEERLQEAPMGRDANFMVDLQQWLTDQISQLPTAIQQQAWGFFNPDGSGREVQRRCTQPGRATPQHL